MQQRRSLYFNVSRHLRSAGVPRYAHRFGPHKFRTAQLVLGLAVREAYRLSFRRAAAFLDEHHQIRMHWTTLQKASARLPVAFWHGLLAASAQVESMLAAVDATGYARSCPSEHYLRRIDGQRPQVPIKLSALVDVKTRKILSARVRVRPAHDVRDVHGLIRRCRKRPWVLVADKGYDSEPLHEWLDEQGVWSIAPPRRGCRHGRHRTRLRDHFPEAEYAERNIVEAVFRRLKALFGGHVRGRTARTVRAELFMRLILNNLILRIQGLFLQTLTSRKI